MFQYPSFVPPAFLVLSVVKPCCNNHHHHLSLSFIPATNQSRRHSNSRSARDMKPSAVTTDNENKSEDSGDRLTTASLLPPTHLAATPI